MLRMTLMNNPVIGPLCGQSDLVVFQELPSYELYETRITNIIYRIKYQMNNSINSQLPAR
jgi:hypothetical protein